jgi:hypothetical protein
MKLRTPSPAAALAAVALFFALGGTAIAAKHYLITSTKQIKPSVLKSLKGKAGKTGPAGPAGAPGAAGPQGAAGPKGEQGPPGPSSLHKIFEVRGERHGSVEIEPGLFIASSFADCPEGSRVVSGGSEVEDGKETFEQDSEREPEEFEGGGRAWGVFVFYGAKEGSVEAIGYCASESGAVQASHLTAAKRRATAATWEQKTIAQFRAAH